MPTLPGLKDADKKAGLGQLNTSFSEPDFAFGKQRHMAPGAGAAGSSGQRMSVTGTLVYRGSLGQRQAQSYNQTATSSLMPALAAARASGRRARFSGDEEEETTFYDMRSAAASLSPPRRGKDTIDDVVEVLCEALEVAGLGKPCNLRSFTQVDNPHRKEEPGYLKGDELLHYQRRRVLKALKKFPFCNIYELIECPVSDFRNISQELGGLSQSLVKQLAVQRVQVKMDPMTRATFWNTVGVQQRPVERGVNVQFAAPRQRRAREPPPTIPGMTHSFYY
mmetsp:Transcript_58951/g.140738  ORF Transcript_58951/g.140738 Transcript_58951/m.140738 type:complete len:279 (+) Transcript_58951:175-1011(+)